jgi:hypothetical protein
MFNFIFSLELETFIEFHHISILIPSHCFLCKWACYKGTGGEGKPLKVVRGGGRERAWKHSTGERLVFPGEREITWVPFDFLSLAKRKEMKQST